MFPKVIIGYSNNNLLAAIAAIDGKAGMIGTVATVGLQGVPKLVTSLADAESKGFTLIAEPTFHRQLKEFYTEVGGEQDLWIMGVADTMAMKDMLDVANASGAIKLINAAKGEIRLLATFRKPPVGYAPGADFFDTDVDDAVVISKSFGEALVTALTPARFLIEGRVVHDDSVVVYAPNSSDNGFAGVVVGGSLNDGSASVGLALGRAVKFPAHIKIGKVANGPLSITAAYIGTKTVEDFPGLETFHNKGLISLLQHPNKAGYFFGVDNMASTNDFRLLAYGRVIDKAAIITASVYVEELESEVDVDENGQINELDIEHLKGRLEQSIKTNMDGQISNAEVIINPKQDIITTGKLQVKVKVTPKGYTSQIEVNLGLNAPS
jgi:hypothetical protein